MDSELEPIPAQTQIKQIHRDLATYDLVAMPVIDQDRNLIGAGDGGRCARPPATR